MSSEQSDNPRILRERFKPTHKAKTVPTSMPGVPFSDCKCMGPRPPRTGPGGQVL